MYGIGEVTYKYITPDHDLDRPQHLPSNANNEQRTKIDSRRVIRVTDRVITNSIFHARVDACRFKPRYTAVQTTRAPGIYFTPAIWQIKGLSLGALHQH